MTWEWMVLAGCIGFALGMLVEGALWRKSAGDYLTMQRGGRTYVVREE